MDSEQKAYFTAFTVKEYRIIKSALAEFQTTCTGNKDAGALLKSVDRILRKHTIKVRLGGVWL